MNKYNYQFEQCVNSISLTNDTTEHPPTTIIILKAAIPRKVTHLHCLLDHRSAGAQCTCSVAMPYTSALPDQEKLQKISRR